MGLMNPYRWLCDPICDWPKMDVDVLGMPYVIGGEEIERRKISAPHYDGWPDVPDHFAGIDPSDYGE